jgi:hypothetical protein
MQPNHEIDVLRADDLLSLHVEFYGLSLATPPGQPARLTRSPGHPAFIVVRFPPQHIAEEAFAARTLGSKPTPYAATISGPSSLAFMVPDDTVEIPYTLQDVLDCLRKFALAHPDPQSSDVPGSGLEVPYRLMLIPAASDRWSHRVEAVALPPDGWIELWHTRMGASSGDDTGDLSARAVDTRAPNIDPFSSPAVAALTARQRTEIVQRSSNPADNPLRVEQFMLTALGASVHLRSDWRQPLPAGTSLVSWHHIVSLGRDQYVRIVEQGFLFPFGHRAARTTITARDFIPVPTAGQAGVLVQRSFITVQQPERDYGPLLAAYAHHGREMPFRRIRLLTLDTPTLDVPAGGFLHDGSRAFKFHLVAEDALGQPSDFGLPLIFVRGDQNTVEGLQLAQRTYAGELANRTADLRNQKVALGEDPDNPGQPGDSGLKVGAMTFHAQLAVADPTLGSAPVPPLSGLHVDKLPPGDPLFLPILESADVSLPAVDQLFGSSGVSGATTVALHPSYLTAGYSTHNPNRVFAALLHELTPTLPADKAGGLAAPTMRLNGLSRLLGPVAKVDSTLPPLPPPNGPPGSVPPPIDPGDLIGDTKLLGAIALKDIVAAIPPGSPAPTPEDLSPEHLLANLDRPDFKLSTPVLTTRSTSRGVETYFAWKPALKPPGTFGAFVLTGDTQLALHALTIAPVGAGAPADGTSPTSQVGGTLSSFALEFGKVIRVAFDRLTFKAAQGQPMGVEAVIAAIDFGGKLQFVNELRNVLPLTGFGNAPTLGAGPDGVVVGYSLGIPSVGVGVFSLQNIALSASLSLPFVEKPATVRFALSERHHPFLVTAGIFGGGGYFALEVPTTGDPQIEAAIEFGGNVSLDLFVARGGVYLMAGLYFAMKASEVDLHGYLRCGGYLEVLGIISIAVEFYMELLYVSQTNKVAGTATLTVAVKVLFFSTSVSLSLHKEFAGSGADPTFDEVMCLDAWRQYCEAFA